MENNWKIAFRNKMPRTFKKLFLWEEIAKSHLYKQPKSVLDLGCGVGVAYSVLFNNEHIYSVGIDAYKEYCEYCKKSGIYNKVICMDLRDLKGKFKEKSFDVVLLFEVLEHLKKKDSLKLLEEAERIAAKQVVVTVPNSWYKGDKFEKLGDFNKNKFQRHLCEWHVSELRKRGYKVRGLFGMKGLRDHSLNLIFREGLLYYPNTLLSHLSQPFVYWLPELSNDLLAVKNLGD